MIKQVGVAVKSLEEISRELVWKVPQFRATVRERIKDLHNKAKQAEQEGNIERALLYSSKAQELELGWKKYSPEKL
jgi:hypothetical protein